METLEIPLQTDASALATSALSNNNDTSQPNSQVAPAVPASVAASVPPKAPANENIGGMTLKKRAPGSAPSFAPSSGGSGARPVFTPRDNSGGPPRPSGPSPNVSKRMERFSRVMPTRDPGVRMNENIRVPEIRVIDDEGQLGVMSPKEAIEIARSRGVDLIEIVPNAVPPVCKLIDFGKWKYEQQKRDKLAKKSAHVQLVKEVRFHPNTDTHDFEFKVRHARNFLLEGHKVKATVQFKGREVAYKQFGEELLRGFQSRLADLSKVDQDLSMMGRMMSMTLSPSSKKKAEGKKASSKKSEAEELKEKSDFGQKLEAVRKKMAEAPTVAEELEEAEEEFKDDTTGLADIESAEPESAEPEEVTS